MVALPNFRWVVNPDGTKDLQQLWHVAPGQRKWRVIPVVKEAFHG